MNKNDGSGLNVQWRSCLSIICLREKIATPPTDYAVSIMALHMLLCGMNSGMAVSLCTSWGFIFWLVYSSDHYSQSTALAQLSHWAVIARLESAKFPHSISQPSSWHWCHNFREGWNNKCLISNFQCITVELHVQYVQAAAHLQSTGHFQVPVLGARLAPQVLSPPVSRHSEDITGLGALNNQHQAVVWAGKVLKC